MGRPLSASKSYPGRMWPNENPASSGIFNYNLKFAGQLYDSHAGLHQNYFREYDSAVGRYVESDPIGLEAGVNLYSYVKSNPIRHIDPLGLKTCGTASNDPYIPDNPFGYPFSSRCESHDKCYADCEGPSRGECDIRFENCMLKKYKKSSAGVSAGCSILANYYALAVRLRGSNAFRETRANCQNCRSSNN